MNATESFGGNLSLSDAFLILKNVIHLRSFSLLRIISINYI